ncbi:hypothetical protein GQ600_16976 [Phytophthora cactorum]|nr:hypothetical protein GQ600_16976 [Phytophthora cactorum]
MLYSLSYVIADILWKTYIRGSSLRRKRGVGFGRVKILLEFLNWDKKNRVRQTAVGTLYFVAVDKLSYVLTTTRQPNPMFFNLYPPTLDAYLGFSGM